MGAEDSNASLRASITADVRGEPLGGEDN